LKETPVAIRTAIFALLLIPATANAQAGSPQPEDVASIEAIVAAAYEAVSRAPGEDFQWDRWRSLFLPGALLVPNEEQTEGERRVLSVDDFIAWVDGWYAQNAPIGGPDDKGFEEAEIHTTLQRYGDIAHVMSTYAKRYWGAKDTLDRGINSIQLVHRDDRWWIAGVVWDEESGAGPIPSEYLPEAEE
jgi:hypothetical protein